MADSNPIVSGDSRHAVAYALLMGLAAQEGKDYTMAGSVLAKADRQWLIENYTVILNSIPG